MKIRRMLPGIIALISLFGITQAFIYSSVLMDGAARLLGWKVRPGFSGGVELARFLDPVGDDKGAGSLVYPLSASPGSLDLVRYTVRQPQTQAPWSDLRDYWQLDLDLANLELLPESGDPAGPTLLILIDTDGAASGSSETPLARSALVDFDPAHPWDICIALDSSLRIAQAANAAGTWTATVPVSLGAAQKRLSLRLPLACSELKRILDGRPTWHYVLIGAWDDHARGHFMTLRERPGQGYGGGSVSELCPRLYDVLSPKDHPQAQELASYDEANLSPARLWPVEVPAWNPWARADGVAVLSTSDHSAANDKVLAALARDAEAEQKRAQIQAREAAAQVDAGALLAQPAGESLLSDLVRAGTALFRADRRDDAKKVFDAVLAIQPGHPIALAYRGALWAQEGGDASGPAEAVRLVNQGYGLMDQAVTLALAGTDPEVQEEVLVVRGSVSQAVPESVFQKARQGAEDFALASELALAAGAAEAEAAQQAAGWLIRAGLCLEAAGEPDQALPYFQKAAALAPTGAAQRLELIKRSLL